MMLHSRHCLTSSTNLAGAQLAMKILSTCLLFSLLILTCTNTNADFVDFQDLDAFLAQFPVHSFEDFEEANVADFDAEVIGNILNSSTNNDVFAAGDIVEGLQIVVNGGGVPNLFVSGVGFANYESHAISFDNSFDDPEITIEFLERGIGGFSFDLTSNPDGNDITVNLFSGASNLGSFLVNDVVGSGTFFGGFSDTDSITRIELSGANFFGVDNIRFAAVPEPSSFLLLIGLGATICRARRRG